ncbi:MAG: hypothetical protein WAW12_16095 [Pseudomonas sp.]
MQLSLQRQTQTSLLTLATLLLVACSSSPTLEGPLSSTTQHSNIQLQGVPGSVRTQVKTTTATISAIDYQTRQVTLKDAQGHRQTLQANPNVQRFEQVKVGDRVHAEVAEETAVFLSARGIAADDGIIQRLLQQARSDQPGMALHSSEQVTAQVTAVDLAQHSVTLRYPNGISRTVLVRPDVALDEHAVGSQVVIRVSTAMLVRVEKP